MLSNHTAERLFDVLGQFPHLSTDARARIANAAETRHPATWADAREVRLDPGHSRSTSLQDVCKPTHGTLPTASEIIAGLHFAAGALA